VLYECGEANVSVDIDTSPQNQQISLWAARPGRPSSTTFWLRDPDLAKRLSPDDRLVTVSQYGIHGGREWIVLENEIRVVDSVGETGLDDPLLVSAPIAPHDHDEIAALVRAIGPKVRGNDWSAEGVIDGLWLNVCFSRTGERGLDDIELNNVWIDEIGPLIEAISLVAPKDHALNYPQIIAGDSELRNHRPIVHSLKEKYAFSRRPPRTPWWCVWRCLVH